MRFPTKITTAFACALVVGACAVKSSKRKPNEEKAQQSNGITLTGMVPTKDSIQAELVDKHCVSCHGEDEQAHGLRLTDISTSISLDDDIIIPSNADGSEFYKQMLSGQMPPEGEHISADSLAVVKSWIDGLPKPKEEEPIKVEATLQSVQAWVNRDCLKCHDEATERNHQVDLTDISKLIMTVPGQPTSGIGGKIITPSKPLSSIFYTIMDSTFTTDPMKLMPRKADPVDPAILATIKAWIGSLPELKVANPCETDPNGPDCEIPVRTI